LSVVREQPGVERRWRSAFELVSIRACVPLWQRAGLPSVVAQDPATLLSSAREFVLSFERQPGTPRLAWTPSDVAVWVGKAFDRVATAYGRAAAREVRSWAERFEVDQVRRQRWSDWSVLFGRLASAYGPEQRPSTPVTIAAEPLSRIQLVIRRSMNPTHEAELARRRAEAEQAQLSPIELQLLATVPGETRSGVVPHWSVLDAFEVIVSRRAAYEIWSELVTLLNIDERRALMRWGAVEAAAAYRSGADLDISSEFVAW